VTTGAQNILLGTTANTGGSNITTGSNNIGLGYNAVFGSATSNNQLNIGNTIFGTITATSTSTSVPTNFSGTLIGIASTSPWARLSVHANNLGSAPAFAVGSSTGTNLIVTNGGLVGIGTTTPGSILSVQGVGNFTTATSTFTSTGGINLANGGCFAISGVCVGAGAGTVGTGTTGQFPYYAANGTTLSATSSLFLATSGYLGIGTTSPTSALDVNGGLRVTLGSAAAPSLSFTNDSNTGIRGTGVDSLVFVTGGSDRGVIGNDGVLTWYQTVKANTQAGDGSAANPSIAFQNSFNLGFFRAAADQIGIATAGVERLRIGAGGNLGIGTTTPSQALSVQGSALFSGNLSVAAITATSTITATTFNASGASNNLLTLNGDVLFFADGGSNISVGSGNVSSGGGSVAFGRNNTAADAGYNIAFGSGNTVTNSQSVGVGSNNTISGFGGLAFGAGNTASGTLSAVFGNNIINGIDNSLMLGPSDTSKLTILSTQQAGFGTTSPFANFSVHANDGETNTTLFAIGSSTASATSTLFSVLNTGRVGIGSTSPWARLSIDTGNLGTAPAFVIGSSSITSFIVTSAGKVGIGTTSPNSKLEILEANSVPQFRLSNGSGYTDFTVDSTGDLKFTTNGGDIRALSENLWVCDNAGCPALTATSTSGNIFVENSTTFGNGFSLKNLSSTELGLYDHAGSQVLIFDEGI